MKRSCQPLLPCYTALSNPHYMRLHARAERPSPARRRGERGRAICLAARVRPGRHAHAPSPPPGAPLNRNEPDTANYPGAPRDYGNASAPRYAPRSRGGGARARKFASRYVCPEVKRAINCLRTGCTDEFDALYGGAARNYRTDRFQRLQMPGDFRRVSRSARSQPRFTVRTNVSDARPGYFLIYRYYLTTARGICEIVEKKERNDLV